MSTDSTSPAALADAQRRGHMVALSVAEQVISICPQLPDTVEINCHSWAPNGASVRLYFHSSEVGVAALARELAVRTTTRPCRDDNPAPYTSLDAVVDGVPVHAWTLGDNPADATESDQPSSPPDVDLRYRANVTTPERYLRSSTGLLHLRMECIGGGKSTSLSECGKSFDLGREAIPLIVGEGARVCKRCAAVNS